MALLEIDNLSMSYADKQLYNNASLQLQARERMGIVGQNGAGKSTLIKIITEQILPVSGTISWQKNIRVGYLDQYAEIPLELTAIDFLHTAFNDLYTKETQLTAKYTEYADTGDEQLLIQAGQLQAELESAGFYDLDTKVEKIITGLGLTDLADQLTASMSGGQRSKLILAKLLLAHNDVIILDEPTNYLDTVHIAWLVEFLQNYAGAALIVSHDYEFLEQVTTTIADVAFGKITKYRGSFRQAMQQKDASRNRQLREFTKQQTLIAKTEQFINKNRAGTKSKQAKSRERMLDKLEVITAPDQLMRARFEFPYTEIESQVVLTVNNLEVGYEQPLLAPVSFKLVHGQKIALTGFNGVGKSTLIKSLLGQIKTLGGSSQFAPAVAVNYFSQELIWENDQLTPLEVLSNSYPMLEQRELRQRLGSAGINNENAQKQIALLSGGEQAKVKLALMELVPSNFLILDEPTNHLDETTKIGLQKALQKFPGNVILVSHETDFYRDWLPNSLDVAALSLQATTEE